MTDKKQTEHQRFWFKIGDVQQWYAIMSECRAWFGKNWKSQPRVRRHLPDRKQNLNWRAPRPVWFDIPDERFATWISVKMSIEVHSDSRHQANK